MAREYVWLECTETARRLYRVNKEIKGADRLQLRKYNRMTRTHTAFKEIRKK